MSRRILAVVAHPDDETLGCGGTLSRHAKTGDLVSVMTFTDGVMARDTRAYRELALERRQHFAAALSALGVWRHDGYPEVRTDGSWYRGEGGSGWSHDGFPDQRLDSVAFLNLAKSVEIGIERFCPDVIYTHAASDLNLDHRLVHQAVLTAVRPVSTNSVREIYACEVPSSTEWGLSPFRPTLFVDISETLEAKLKAMACYTAEVRDYPHPRSTEALRSLAKWRGATSGYYAAEAFDVLRLLR